MTIFDDLLAMMRIKKAYPYIKKGTTLLDIGCGDGGLLYSVKKKISFGLGIDPITTTRTEGVLNFIKATIDKKLPEGKEFDNVTLLATLEHLKYKQEILQECYRVLKRGGNLIITMPSPKTDKLIDKLLKMRILSQKEFFEQHNNIPTAEELIEMVKKIGMFFVYHQKFEFGYNNLFVFRKVL
jgi:ubiquinone/menaquinone biosynthesis C-methylase UbiE